MSDYDFKTIEPKWQERWLKENLFAASDSVRGQKMYVLDMFPYPSGDGLHVGHAKIYTASDVVARYLRMKGFNVLHPTGWDAFGLPTENSAIALKIHPAELTKRNIERFRQQMQRVGWSYDWNRGINTTDPQYYKWTQWIFLKLFKMGLAYQDTVPINWCPRDKTGLANEEVVDGRCERCGTPVELRPMRQWLMRITKYADRLLDGLAGFDWPAFIVELQRNWIGRKEGAEIKFAIRNPSSEIAVFTTRADTIFGATFVAVSPDHPLIEKIITPEQAASVAAYRQELASRPAHQLAQEPAKTGIFTGSFAVNPLNQEPLPIWITDYVMMGFGTGAIMGVPAHDERDFAFAQKYQLPIKPVVVPTASRAEPALPYIDDGVLVNSGAFSGQPSQTARESIIRPLVLRGQAQKKTHYKLRDWVFSRQRYWGEPIPIIHCSNCGAVPVPEKDLPVVLPPVEHYEPTGTGESPLAAIASWVNVKCPTCPRMATRETNTMPQWAGSSWYWLRYLSSQYREALADPVEITRWMPVDLYVGGAEHAVLHLLYARFWTKALFDAGLVPQDEPFKRFRAVGLILGQDGQKMSKSRGNVVNPDDVVRRYGADTLRVYEMFMGPFEHTAPWNTHGIAGAHRFLKRVWKLIQARLANAGPAATPEEELAVQLAIRRVSASIENFRFNTAISSLMELLNALEKMPTASKASLERLAIMLAPFAPHLAEELWQALGHAQSLMYERWPPLNERLLVAARRPIPVQVNGRLRGTITIEADAAQAAVEAAARAVPNVAKYLDAGQIAKVIYVPAKSINFVVS